MIRRNKITLLILLYLFPLTLSADIHVFKVEEPEIRIYPFDITLTIRQQHAALNELALHMNSGTIQDRLDFVRIALQEMAILYDEAAEWHNDRPGFDTSLSVSRWRDRTRSLALQIYNTAELITPDTPLDISLADTGEVHIMVNDDLYILNSPLIHKPFLLDERIINKICEIKYCDPDLPAIEGKGVERKITVNANWVINENEKPRYVTADGLNFVFNNLENRSEKQIASLKVIKEIKLIAETLKDAGMKGVMLEWERLAIKSLRGSYDHRININRFGDTVYIKLPELHHVANWQEQIMPWIRAQVEEQSVDQYLDADKFLAYALNKGKSGD